MPTTFEVLEILVFASDGYEKARLFFQHYWIENGKISTTSTTSFPTPFPCIKILRSSLENLKAFSKSGVMSNKMNK